MSLLSRFAPRSMPTDVEKKYRLKKLAQAIEEGEVDEEMIPYLERLNRIVYVVTTQCCCGHGGKKRPHVDLRTTLGMGKTLAILHAIDPDESISLEVMGWSDPYLPRYCFWLPREGWEEMLDKLIHGLEHFPDPPYKLEEKVYNDRIELDELRRLVEEMD